ncbi:tgf beta receptor associated protein [Sporothrix schenckii 1099-18]|uniref:Tgf beta receptor associated protein n=1 Tax=Sporothrix schenckii 1099-18 TaxID=1397361 RepID=A0A0F2LU33_SPOSC|nr:tgf beta receptor associated protein [Sporothrix schenckii 1099-18]KJR80374.1 tgf beta receptor associated protein [Sporothrix schenckii 1099-18]
MAAEAVASGADATALERGPFVLRSLLKNVPLSADGTEEDIRINCVDYYDGNLYVGTSASELLHFVQLPPDPDDESSTSTFMLASRLSPPFTEPVHPPGPARPGVQQIVLLPPVGKACVLCNWTVTFYSLPELTPIFRDVKNCNWIGGVDLSEELATGPSPRVTVLLSLNRRLQVVRIGEDPRVVKNIDFGASILSVRRDAIACVADARNYALVHVEQQLKIPLTSISSLDQQSPEAAAGQVQNLKASGGDSSLSRSSSSAQAHTRSASTATQQSGHSRSTSLGSFMTGSNSRSSSQPPPPPPPKENAEEGTAGQDSSSPSKPSSVVSRSSAASGDEAAAQPALTPAVILPPPPPPKPTAPVLKPLVVSPTPDEFLIVTGTGPSDAGIGMFVNLDGDPTRPTLEFERYPTEIVVDGGVSDLSSSRPSPGGGGPGDEEDDGYILASISKGSDDDLRYGLEVQRWDVNVGEGEVGKFWLETPGKQSGTPVGVHRLVGSQESVVCEVVDRLAQKRFSLPKIAPEPKSAPTKKDKKKKNQKKETQPKDDTSASGPETHEEEDASRNRAEVVFATRLAKTTGRIAVWSGDRIWWAMRNPVVLQLEAGLEAASSESKVAPETADERRELFTVLKSLRGRDAKTELEFVTFSYIRQRGGALLFMGLPHATDQEAFSDAELKALEEVLLDSALDPRVLLALVPELRNEIIQSRKGIWIFGGVKNTFENYLAREAANTGKGQGTVASLNPKLLQFLRRFLIAWRKKKGFGSVADESDVFRTVDAALLSVLLELDQHTPKGLAYVKPDTVRGDLNDVVDKGVDCFDRAVELLESHHRLFVLSRLYQSRKMAGDVLATWKRIVEGERDDGGELVDGENRIRDYLSKVSNQALVQEYGLWLANRNPRLGVQIFADDKARAPKFEPTQVVPLLREHAPGAVRYYLEHLVFSKGHSAYVDELISYYLEVVTGALRSSKAARDTMFASYGAYRALQPPKPTFHQFLADNAVPGDEEWQSRLRLLELLGGPHPYDVAAIRARLADSLPADQPAERLLVPETIILNGREHRHEDALRLLVHGLGDYDTAVKYCLLGGSSLYDKVRDATVGSAASNKLPQRRESLPPTVETQAKLFRTLLVEFLAIEDVSDRVEQTGSLLGRFAGWFDVLDVLQLLPDSWSIEVTSGFLVHSLRELVRDRNQSTVARALSASENLRVHDELITKADEIGPRVEAEN